MRIRLLAAVSIIMLALLIGCAGDTEYSPSCPNPEVALGDWSAILVGGRPVIVDTVYINGGYYSRSEVLPAFKAYRSMPEYSVSFDTSYAGVREYFAVLTNGSDEEMSVQFTWPNGWSRVFNSESEGLKGGVTGELLPDLAGTEVTRVMYHVIGLYLDHPGEDPNNDGIWTDYIITVNIEFWGYLEE